STFLLLPIFVALAAIWAIVDQEISREKGWRLASFGRCLGRTGLIVLIAYLSIYPIYVFHTWNYSPQHQRLDTIASLEGPGVGHTPKNIVIWASDKPLLRPYAQYFRGLFMSVARSNSSDNRFFLGRIYQKGIPLYFPFVYLVKEPLAIHLF